MKATVFSRFRARSLCVATLLSLATLAIGGCDILGTGAVVADSLFPPRVDPQYVPLKTETMLVLVENRQNPGMVLPESDQLTGFICADLTAQNVCNVIPQAKLEELRDKDPDALKKMSITEIGKALGAQQVLYVDVVRVDTSVVAGTTTNGRVDMQVHVVDVPSGKTAWPVAPAVPAPVSFQTHLTQQVPADRIVLFHEQLMRGAATSVSRLFYEWDPESDKAL